MADSPLTAAFANRSRVKPREGVYDPDPLRRATNQYEAKQALRTAISPLTLAMEALTKPAAALATYSPDADATVVPAEAVKPLEVLRQVAVALKNGEDPRKVFEQFGVYRGPVDNQLRAVIDDSAAKLKPEAFVAEHFAEGKPILSHGDLSLADVLDHPALFNAVPDLHEVRVMPEFPRPGAAHKPIGSYDRYDDVVRVAPGQPSGDYMSTLLHELQHALQRRAGFSEGGSPDMLKAASSSAPEADYLRLGGEAEARAVQRMFHNDTYSKEFQGPIAKYYDHRRPPPYNPSRYPLDFYDVPLDEVTRSPLDQF